MENLPPQILIEILNRLPTAVDLASCRLTCKTLNSLSYEVTAVTLICPYNRYYAARSSAASISFKPIATAMVSRLPCLDFISVAVDGHLQGLSYDDVEDDEDDLHLTDSEFVEGWLRAGFKTLSFADFWVQSCDRKSRLLSSVSGRCQRLNKLEIKNAWLSMEGVSVMLALTSLTLEFVRFDDENLSKLSDCFPCLETLNLIGVGGLTDPKINLQRLKSCQCTVSNVPLSLTITAPNLIELKLKCVRPRSLVLETPMLLNFHLVLEKACTVDIGELPYLRNLQLESRFICDLVNGFPCAKALKELCLDSPNGVEVVKAERLWLRSLFDIFPNMNTLKLGSNAYSEIEASFGAKELEEKIGMKCLRNFTARLVIRDIDITISFISFILDKCNNLSAISLLIHHEIDSLIAENLISRCMGLCPRVRWKWGNWKEGSQDVWLTDGF